ncbi:P-loop ATPase, Sll1717 family [Hydrogenophaga sp. BPS33]|uniref:P-loop ATPase, Sll1717 family n=1 Tax=Hydrogenophaga sp. BPS33 TaxID=2651974 RepID=UPI001320098E|nr:P-loop NTPase fold protein [Hydrogenophaga sp. BPS33]QHE85371.1 DNA repair protein [Hydrogenophaga sp. BPS33]
MGQIGRIAKIQEEINGKKDVGASFRFKNNDRIGEAAAESDEKFLFECFVDSGDIDLLSDCSAPQRIIVGRTGSGKSALIKVLESREDHVINLVPEQLALSYLSNSEVLRFFENAGANLDLFYQLLWRHVLTVELLKYKYKITNESSQRSFLSSLTNIFSRDKTKEQAITYLRDWGENFWNETEYRVKEITEKIENDLRASLGANGLGAKLEAGASQKLTAEEKLEVISRGSRVVSQVQIRALSDVIKLLADEIFSDDQEAHFVVIDDLDTKWVEDPLKYKLIRALIETVKTFRQIQNVKIVVSLRLDLLQRVISATRDSGFQSEKYEALYLKIAWRAPQLIELINRRVAHLVKQRYTSRAILLDELFPKRVGHISFSDYLIQRTFLRPRDAIIFVNECIARASDRGQISTQIVHDAEGSYSQKRIDSLQEEWSGMYPYVADYIKIFSRRPVQQKISEFSEESIREWLYDVLLRHEGSSDPVVMVARAHINDGKPSHFKFLLTLFDSLYCVGAVGIKPDAGSPEYWSYYSEHSPGEGSLKPASVIKLHPTFWRAVGARPN